MSRVMNIESTPTSLKHLAESSLRPYSFRLRASVVSILHALKREYTVKKEKHTIHGGGREKVEKEIKPQQMGRAILNVCRSASFGLIQSVRQDHKRQIVLRRVDSLAAAGTRICRELRPNPCSWFRAGTVTDLSILIGILRAPTWSVVDARKLKLVVTPLLYTCALVSGSFAVIAVWLA